MKKFVRTGIVAVLMFGVGFLAQAHEFWMQPLKFYYSIGEQLVVSFKVGENFLGENWKLKKERLVRVELHHQKGVENLNAMALEADEKQLTVPLKSEGTQVVVMESN